MFTQHSTPGHFRPEECQSWVVITQGMRFFFFLFFILYFLIYFIYIYIHICFPLLVLFIAFLLFIYSFSTHITIWTVTKVHKFAQQQLYWGTHWWRYATWAVTKAHKFTRCSAPGHNGSIEPRTVNHKMESQGHYMETFSCFIYLLTYLFFCYLFIVVNIYMFFILSNFNFYYNYFCLFYYCIFFQYRHMHLMQTILVK